MNRRWLAVAFCGAGGSALATILFTASFHYVNPSVTILLQKLQPAPGDTSHCQDVAASRLGFNFDRCPWAYAQGYCISPLRG